MRTTTTIRTEYAGFGKTPDGVWHMITPTQKTETGANGLLQQHIADSKKFPDCYFSHDEYKVRKRTVITTREAWGDTE